MCLRALACMACPVCDACARMWCARCTLCACIVCTVHMHGMRVCSCIHACMLDVQVAHACTHMRVHACVAHVGAGTGCTIGQHRRLGCHELARTSACRAVAARRRAAAAARGPQAHATTVRLLFFVKKGRRGSRRVGHVAQKVSIGTQIGWWMLIK